MVHVATTVPAKTHLEVSVLLNVWSGDKPEDVKRSIRSILWQTALPCEILVVSDGPAGEVMRAVIQKSLVNQTVPFRFIETEHPRGLWNARNVGIEAARFEVVFLQDADDVMHPKRLEIQYPFMLDRQADVCGTWAVEFDSEMLNLLGWRTPPENSDELLRKMTWRNVLCHSSVAVRKSTICSVGLYRDVYLAEDYDLWLRLIATGAKVMVIPLPLQALSVGSTLYRRRGGFKFLKSERHISRLLKNQQMMSLQVRIFRLLPRLMYRLGPRFARATVNRFLLINRKGLRLPELFEKIGNRQSPILTPHITCARTNNQHVSALADFVNLKM